MTLKKYSPWSLISCDARRKAQWSVALLSLLAGTAYANEPLDCLIEPHVLVDVSSSELGVIESVTVNEADVVRKGQAVAKLHTDVERAAFAVTRARAEATSDIELLRRDHDYNSRKRDRIDELHEQSAVSAQDVDEVRTAQDAAWLRLQAAVEKQRTAQLEATRDELALARRTVHSPIDGVVVSRYKSAGEFVDGDPILQLAQLDPLLVRVVVPISTFGQFQVGMQATISPELPIDGPFVASVISIDPLMDAATATLGVRLSLPNPEHRLPPGLKCTLVLHPLDQSLPEAVNSVASAVAAESISTHTTPSSNLLPQLGAATLHVAVPKSYSVATSNNPNTQTAIVSNEPADLESVQAVTSDNNSCVTLGPLKGVAVADTISAVLNASDIRFQRRYVGEENKPTAESTLWLDIVGEFNDPMHSALMDSIREYYPALLELPVDCAQVVTR